MNPEEKSFEELDELTVPQVRACAQHVIDQITMAARDVPVPSDLLDKTMEKVRQLPPPQRQFNFVRWSRWVLPLAPAFAAILLILPLMPWVHKQMHQQSLAPAPQGSLRVNLRFSDKVNQGMILVCGKRRPPLTEETSVFLRSENNSLIVTGKIQQHVEGYTCPDKDLFVLSPQDFKKITSQVEAVATATFENAKLATRKAFDHKNIRVFTQK